ncbi:hypothetical protein, partial [Pseudoflavonifractor phocaeensis]|uniref:hypothetical protein n=1 Tax=Pseudoflavonifractor phocaeensis TaxID=1870988 RepID=UPI00195E3153
MVVIILLLIFVIGMGLSILELIAKNYLKAIINFLKTIAIEVLVGFLINIITTPSSPSSSPAIYSTAPSSHEIEETMNVDELLTPVSSSFSTPPVVTATSYLKDVTEEAPIKGSITEDGQEDQYRYTAKVKGTYRFSTDLNAGGEVRVRISGENGKSLGDAINSLSIELEAGKTYILSIEYSNGPCDYTVSIGAPNPIEDATGSVRLSGKLTYKGQKDRYHYIAHTSGIYRFSTDLSAGGEVRVRISGENDKSLDDATNSLN